MRAGRGEWPDGFSVDERCGGAGLMRVALVHESLTGYYGSERVLAELAGMYPEAPIFATVHRPERLAGTPLAGREVRCTVLDRWPVLRRRHRWLLPAMPWAVEQHDLSGFDLVISSHHAAAHGVLTRSDQLHLCYTHSPARYAWELQAQHLPAGRRAPVRRWLLHRFRQWDVAAGQRPDAFAANSAHVAARVAKTYRRPAEVIYPPVAVGALRPDREREDFYLVAGRLVSYKNVEVVVRAMAQLERPTVVVGEGPERRRIEKLAKRIGGGRMVLERGLDDAAFADRLERCRALVFAGQEDFGMVPVEAMAAGAPVIALGRGGLRETVEDGVSGVFFDEPTPEALVRAVRRFEGEGLASTAGERAAAVARFGPARFREVFGAWVEREWARFREGSGVAGA